MKEYRKSLPQSASLAAPSSEGALGAVSASAANLNLTEVTIVIGTIVKVIVDRPLGTYHPKHKDIYYSVNYGYIPGVIAQDGEEQDAYILGVSQPIHEFVGKVIAIIHRFDDVEEKWVVAPEDISFTKDEIMRQVAFQEQYFRTEIRI